MSWIDDPVTPSTIDGYPVLYRTNRVVFEKEAKYDPVMKDLWENINNDAYWWLIYSVFLPAITGDSFVLLQFYGMSRSGKSWLAIAKALLFKKMLEWAGFDDVKIYYTENWSQTLDILPKCKRGDIIINDEESRLGGSDSQATEEAMKNVLKSCRWLGIHIFFLDPEDKSKPNIDAWIRVAGLIEAKWTTMSIVYGPKDKNDNAVLVGWDFTEIPVESDEWKEQMIVYEPFKEKMVTRILSQRGRVGADVDENVQILSEELIEYALERQEEDGLKPTKDRLNDWILKIGGGRETIATQGRVVTRAYDALTKGDIVMKGQRDEENRVTWRIVKTGTKELPEEFKERLVPYLKSQYTTFNETAKKKLDKRWVDWAIDWMLGVAQDAIANSAGTDQSSVSKGIRRVRESILGLAVERLLADENPSWKYGGGYEAQPDFETDEQIISIKARMRSNIQIDYTDFGKAERAKALATGKELILIMYELKAHNIVNTYRAEPMGDDEDES